MRKIYLDLDTLLDTRLALLAELNPEAATRVLDSNAYWDRETTNWATLTNNVVTNEQFEAAWLKRGTTVLHQAVITGIIPVLAKIISDYQVMIRDGVNSEELALEINVWPYDFTMEDMDGLTEIIQKEVFYDDLPILYASISLEELTPQFINDNYAAMVFFEFHRWIKIHCHEINKTRCKGLSLVVPKLFEHDVSRLPVERKKEELLTFKLWLLDYLSLDFIDARWFSLLRPDLSVPHN